MASELKLLQSAMYEYRSIAVLARQLEGEGAKDNAIEEALCQDHDWTAEGAGTILSLANGYGAFILRNALALALALGKEDGDLGL